MQPLPPIGPSKPKDSSAERARLNAELDACGQLLAKHRFALAQIHNQWATAVVTGNSNDERIFRQSLHEIQDSILDTEIGGLATAKALRALDVG